MKVLITGGAGYLGTVIAEEMLQHGWDVTVLDNLLYRQQSLLHLCRRTNFGFVVGDVRDKTLMEPLVASHDVVVPLAAIVGAKACDEQPELTRAVNFEAIRLLGTLRSADQPVIFPCTNSGYGTKSGDFHCTEESPLEPISLYGETKVAAEQEVLSWTNTATLRLATVFGPSPRMRLDLLVNDFTYRAYRDGYLVIYEHHFKRNYLHVSDVARCFIFAIENIDRMGGEPYNVGLNDANLSKGELANAIQKHVPGLYTHFSEIGSDPDKRNYIISNAKINEKGFTAKTSLDEGIRQLLTMYRALGTGTMANA